VARGSAAASLPLTEADQEATVPKPLSLAHSPCPNDTFIFHAWSHGLVPGAPAVEATLADIDVTNHLAERDEFDILKISFAALPGFLDRYTLLPCGGALGRGCGPLVVSASAAGPASLVGATVAIPAEKSTAYLLFRMWAARAVPGGVGRIVVLPFHQIMPSVLDGSVDAGLIIHEARFTYRALGLHRLVDLGEDWEAQTGLPIPLGAIVAKRSLGAERLAGLAAAARASVEFAWASPEVSRGYVREHAQEMDPDVVAQHIGLYVNEFTAELGTAGYAAVRALLDGGAAAGACPPIADGALDFPAADPPAPVRRDLSQSPVVIDG
jgi:1,4-dihydroxy-6-naphthoate synthase